MSEEYHSVYLTQAKFNAPVKKTSQESFAINVPQDIITFLNANVSYSFLTLTEDFIRFLFRHNLYLQLLLP